MKLNPKYFNNLRIKPKKLSKKKLCDYGGCNEHGEFLAKTKSSAEFFYCLNHIKDFNKNYNFFEGMSEEETKNLIIKLIDEIGITDISQIGKIMPHIMKNGGGSIDGKMANKILRELLS